MNFIMKVVQRKVAELFFPSDRDDWYIEQGFGDEESAKSDFHQPFNQFVEAITDGRTSDYNFLKPLEMTQRFIETSLYDRTTCVIEAIRFTLPLVVESTEEKSTTETTPKPALGKHLIYFTGMGSCYQACLEDIAICINKTGATVHAFNYPGHRIHGGRITQAADMVNSGIAMLNDLLDQGVAIDDIILQGDSFGAAIAREVQRALKQKHNINIRGFFNNTFGHFEKAVLHHLTPTPCLGGILKKGVPYLLNQTGWNLHPANGYGADTPFHCHLQHQQDKTLGTATLDVELNHYLEPGFEDPCPEIYKADRDRINRNVMVRVKPELYGYFMERYNLSKSEDIDGHLADICQLELLDGGDVYDVVVNDYLRSSQAYVDANRQSFEGRLEFALVDEEPKVFTKPTSQAFFDASIEPTAGTGDSVIEKQPSRAAL